MWDFSTEPEFQEKLDWMARFVREECETLDLLFPHAAASGVILLIVLSLVIATIMRMVDVRRELVGER